MSSFRDKPRPFSFVPAFELARLPPLQQHGRQRRGHREWHATFTKSQYTIFWAGPKQETAYCKRRNPGGMQAEIGVHQPISLGDLWIKARKDSAAG